MATQIDKVYSLNIGVQGENIARAIELDMTAWVEAYPDASFHVLFKPYNESEALPMVSSFEDNILTWTPTLSATAVSGVGYTEIRAIDPDTGLIRKSRIIPTSVENSVSGTEADPPAPYQDWVNRVLKAGVDAVSGAAAVASVAQGEAVAFEINEGGHLVIAYTEGGEQRETDLGPVDAYAIAVVEGYTGTREGWVQAMADAEANGLKAEGYAVGKQNGVVVESGEYYQNNAKYYNEQAQSAKEDAETAKTVAEAAQASATASAAEAAQYTSDAVHTWLENNIDPATGYALDRTLTEPLAAAPADMVGDLKSAIPAFYIPGELEVRNGAISLTSGLWGFNSNNRAILEDYTGVIKGVCSVAINTGYQALIFAYEPDGTYVGRWTTDNRFQISTGSALFVTGFDFRAFPNYKFNLMIKKDDGADFTPSDYGKLYVNYYTDKSLTYENSPADAKSAGEAITAVMSYAETGMEAMTERIDGHTYTENAVPYGWKLGSIRPETGKPYTTDTRIRSDFIPCGKGAYLYTNDDGNNICVYTYNKDKQWIEYSEGATWAAKQTVPTDGYIRILMKKTGGAAISQSEIDEIASKLVFVYEIPEWLVASISGVGDTIDAAIGNAISTEKMNAYKGELIQISEFNSYGTPSKKRFTAVLITDTHGGALSWQDMVAFVNANTRTVDAAYFLGDLVQEPTSVPDFYDPSAIQKQFAFCIGNHDIGGGPNTAGISPATAFTRYIAPVVSAGHVSTTKNYYYFDNTTYKIRTIVLFEYEAGQDTDSCEAYYYRRYISSEQLQWFADTLYSTPEDYSVIVLTHQQIWKNPTEIEHLFTKNVAYGTISTGAGIVNNMSGNAIGDIVDAFKHSTAINRTYTNNDYTTTGLPSSNVTKDFSGRANGKFICYLSGHAHAPYIIKDSTYQDQLQVIVPAATVDIHQRRMDDIRPEQSQPQYYVVAFDTENKLIKLMKIGRRTTIDMRERNYGVVEYS